jgi:hypothetical protein
VHAKAREVTLKCRARKSAEFYSLEREMIRLEDVEADTIGTPTAVKASAALQKGQGMSTSAFRIDALVRALIRMIRL